MFSHAVCFRGRKKKLSSYISFPEVLDMSAYLPPTSGFVLFCDVWHAVGILVQDVRHCCRCFFLENRNKSCNSVMVRKSWGESREVGEETGKSRGELFSFLHSNYWFIILQFTNAVRGKKLHLFPVFQCQKLPGKDGKFDHCVKWQTGIYYARQLTSVKWIY